MGILEAYYIYVYGNLYDDFYIHDYLCLKEVMKCKTWNFKNIEQLLIGFVVQVLQVTNL